jgi:site-specific recombinase XerD
MMRQLAVVTRSEAQPRGISFAEKLSDHNAVLQSYLDTHITRNHSSLTCEGERRFLQGWFMGFVIEDKDHPEGERQLLVWEAMEPVVGRQRVVEFGKGLALSGLKNRTIIGYLGILRRLFQYVLECPYIPGSSRNIADCQSIIAKYGRIELPVLPYDYPVHVLDIEAEGIVLTGDRLTEFYDFVRLDYAHSNQKKSPTARDYTMIVLAGESGLRIDEIVHLDAHGIHRDLFYESGRIQTRFGKGTKGSGKRVRKTIFTPLAQATMRVYEDRIRPLFPNARTNPALFLSETGTRLSYKAAWASLRNIVKAARRAGIELPPRLSWHSLRKSFATNFMEQHPEKVWVLMDMMGHLNPSTLNRYVKHSRSYYDQVINQLVQELVPKEGPQICL